MTTQLRDIADVQTGFTFRGVCEHALAAPIRVLQAKDITARGTIGNSLTYSYYQPSRLKYLEAGTVVLSARGTFRAAVYAQNESAMASSSVYVIRIRSSRVSPDFLAMYLNSTAAQAYISQHSTGSSIKTVLVDALRNLPIPVVSPDRQTACTALNQNLQRQRELLERRIALNQAIINQALATSTKGTKS